MDNKLRSVMQFAFYTLLFSLSNYKELLIFNFNYIVLLILFLTCLYSIYELLQVKKKLFDFPKKIFILYEILSFALLIEILLIFYNSIFRSQENKLLELVEIVCQAILFYLWLEMFQLYFHFKADKDTKDLQKIQPIHIIKVCFIMVYIINSCYEIYERTFYEQNREYQIQLGLELLYAIIFLYLYGQFYKQHQIDSITSSTDIKSHDPFDEETIESTNAGEDQKYFDYFRFSIICCLSLILNTIIKVFDYNRSNQSYIKQSGIIIVYMMFISSNIPIMGSGKSNTERKNLVEMENQRSLDLEQL